MEVKRWVAEVMQIQLNFKHLYQHLEADWWKDALIGFQVSSSLLRYDVQAPASLEETRNVLKDIQERNQ